MVIDVIDNIDVPYTRYYVMVIDVTDNIDIPDTSIISWT